MSLSCSPFFPVQLLPSARMQVKDKSVIKKTATEACEIITLKHGRPKSNDATATRTWLKSEFAFFQSLTRLFIITYFVKCSGSLDLNSKGRNFLGILNRNLT